jgi:uncharacterized membrane protein
MQQFLHRGWLREHAMASIAAAYVVGALLLGAKGASLGARLLGNIASAMSSASAVAILAAIASGMMALTAIVFSLVFSAMQISGASYSPRLVRVLGRRRMLGHALGLFTGTFLYALLAIRTVDLAGRSGTNLSVVIVALLWLLASVAALVLLIPHLRSLSIEDVLTTLYGHAADAAARVYAPAPHGAPAAAQAPAPDLPVTSVVLHAGRPLYLVGLDVRHLMRCAADAGAVVVVPPAIGDAVIAGDRLAVVLGASRPVAEARLRDGFWLGPDRTIDNDPCFAIRLLVDVAIRALSPAVNDPTTAVSVLDELDGLLRLLGQRRLEDHRMTDDHGVVRLVCAAPSWDDVVVLALTEIHQYGRDSFQVQRRLAALLRDVSEVLPAHRRAAIDRFARWRAASRSEVLHAAEAWADASACDRQGLGHPLPAFDALSPSRATPSTS